MSIKHWIVIALLLTVSVTAADWVQIDIKETWDQKSTGFCQQNSQCLVNTSHSDAYDNQPDRYWSQLQPSEKPKCINTGQYISDHYCDNGQWTTRTKDISLQLLSIALNNNPDNFALYCDSYDNVLNKYDYITSYGSVTSFIRKFCQQPGNIRTNVCTNNICVLNNGGTIAFGFSINTDISGSKSPLQALDLNRNQCDNMKNNDGDYDNCGNNVWYNHDTESILYAPNTNNLPAITQFTTDFLTVPYNRLNNYVNTAVHNPNVAQLNYTFFKTPDYNRIYIAKSPTNFAYAFKEQDKTLARIDYAGWYYANADLPQDACARIIKRYDSKAHCEQQPSPDEFYIVADKRIPLGPLGGQQSIVDAWTDLIKLRLT